MAYLTESAAQYQPYTAVVGDSEQVVQPNVPHERVWQALAEQQGIRPTILAGVGDATEYVPNPEYEQWKASQKAAGIDVGIQPTGNYSADYVILQNGTPITKPQSFRTGSTIGEAAIQLAPVILPAIGGAYFGSGGAGLSAAEQAAALGAGDVLGGIGAAGAGAGAGSAGFGIQEGMAPGVVAPAKAAEMGGVNAVLTGGAGATSVTGAGAAGAGAAGAGTTDVLKLLLGVGGNLIATDMATDAARSAAERGAEAANEAARVYATAAEDVRSLQQELRAPYTQLGKTAAEQYAAGIAPGGQFARPFSMQDATNTEAMRLAQQEALAATQQSAAGRGGLLTANTQEALQKRAAQIGAQYQNQAFNQYLAQQQLLMRPLEQAMTLGAGQVTGQAGAESDALMTAGQGSANAMLAAAGLASGADIANARSQAGLVTSTVDQLIRSGLLNPGAGSNVPSVAPVTGGQQMSYVPYTMAGGQTGTIPMFNLPPTTVYPGEMGFGG